MARIQGALILQNAGWWSCHLEEPGAQWHPGLGQGRANQSLNHLKTRKLRQGALSVSPEQGAVQDEHRELPSPGSSTYIYLSIYL